MDFALEPRSQSAQSQGPPESSGGASRWLLVAALNLLVLGELTWSMYLSHGAGEDTAWVFLKSFLPMAFGTLFLGKLLLRRLFPG